MTNKEIKKDLAYYRKKKGISQEEMGEYLGVPKANISAWENGSRGIPLKHFDKIARMLDLTEAELQEVIAHCREEVFFMGIINFKLVREAIQKSGLSETEWAKRYGFSQRAVNSWVKEERAPRFKNILKLAQALDCSVSDICPNLPCEEFREAVIKTGDHSMLQAAYENKTYPKEFLDQISQEEDRTVAVPEIVGELAQKIYDKAWERAKLRQNVLREKFMEQLKQTYAGFTEEEYQEILYSLIKDEISPILIRGEISRMTSSIAFLAHDVEQSE